ncbi:winged helix DNA-binding domain-containing protein [Listeria sp. FSL L7-1582]|uniref:winged helix DNA-binding domain-containing protein n=1 Tax=Listeria portnoyi TaxID=2713504 RepID=UPI00164DEDA9|nr:winged helix DNA-binding domain-containing protein [Listeria portnoyi]MBC6310426.1 winged helix DNA-binding domain-containing protein [Listeria portnoyi]
MDLDDVRNIRIVNSGLGNSFKSAVSCTEKLIGIQAQYQQFGEISLFHRVDGLTRDALDQIYARNEIIKLWGQRTTVHLYVPEDWKNLHKIYSPRRTWVRKHCEELGVDLDDLLVGIDRLGRSERFIAKEELAELMGDQAKKLMTWGGVLIEASLLGHIYAVPERPSTRFYAHRKWVDGISQDSWQDNVDEYAIDRFLSRYLACYGPATLADFKHWSGLPNYAFLDAFRRIEDGLGRFDIDGKVYYYPEGKFDLRQREVIPQVKLLGKFDPLFVSYADKGWLADAKYEKEIWRAAGHIEAVLLIDGEIRGTWRYVIKGEAIRFTCFAFGRISASDKKRVSVEAERLSVFLGKKLQGIEYE